MHVFYLCTHYPAFFIELEHTLNKSERISSKKDIDHLFASGKSFIAYPLRIVFAEVEVSGKGNASILISVPKRKFKQAVKRNRIKRLIREAYRLNKNILCTMVEEKTYHLLIGFLYLDDTIKDYNDIEKAMKKALMLLQNQMS